MLEDLFQPMHLILVLAIVLIVFGPGKLPEAGKALGEAIRNFKKAFSEDRGDAKLSEPKRQEVDESAK